jgi:cell division protein FtsI (penicillin-binding protein 3)/stage V sporulation protein D (sporulation-specific penicillin-binding protein)
VGQEKERPQLIRAFTRFLRDPWTWVFVLLLALFARAGSLTICPDPRIVARAASSYWRIAVSTPVRGAIVDRRGVLLAGMAPRKSLFVDPAFWQSGNLGKLKGKLPESAMKVLGNPGKGRFRWLVRRMDPASADAVLALGVPGIYGMDEIERVYPHGGMLAHVLGYCDTDAVGLAGVERLYQEYLYAPPAIRLLIRDARGAAVALPANGPDPEGKTVRLTVDARAQMVLETRLAEAAVNHMGKWGAAVLMDPSNGAVLGLASWPGFDANDRKTFADPERLRNNALGRVYEPGSTFKPIVAAMGLELGVTDRTEIFHTPRSIPVGGHTISDVHPKGALNDLRGILTYSLNVGMAQIGLRIPPQTAVLYLKQWGFGLPTGVGMEEEAGLLRAPESWWGSTPATVAIGQGIGVTAIQMAAAFSAFANGGTLPTPHILRSVSDPQGRTVEEEPQLPRTTVITPQTACFVREALRDVVLKGTAKAARSTLVEIGGKTGTAQVAENGAYVPGRYVSSFAGFWPAEKPRYVLVVVIGEPGKGHYGGEVAAPAFRKIAEDLWALDQEERR